MCDALMELMKDEFLKAEAEGFVRGFTKSFSKAFAEEFTKCFVESYAKSFAAAEARRIARKEEDILQKTLEIVGMSMEEYQKRKAEKESSSKTVS